MSGYLMIFAWPIRIHPLKLCHDEANGELPNFPVSAEFGEVGIVLWRHSPFPILPTKQTIMKSSCSPIFTGKCPSFVARVDSNQT